MQDFNKLVRLFLVLCGPNKTVQLRSGEYSILDAPLDPLLPYLAWQSLVCSKILLGVEGVSGKFYCDRSILNITCGDGFQLLDASAALHGLSWILSEIGESKSLVFIEDEISSVISKHNGLLPVQELVSDQMIGSYKSQIRIWQLERNSPAIENIVDIGLTK